MFKMNRKDELKMKFRRWAKTHPNFMTPDIEKLGVKGNEVIELSSGSKMFSNDYNERMFGVTLAKYKGGGEFETGYSDKSKPFESEKKAKAYMKKLMEGKF